MLSLTHLNLSFCLNVEDQTIEKLAQSLCYLSCLNVAGCQKLSDRSVEELGRHALDLAELDVSDCLKLTNFSLEVFELIESLKRVTIINCKKIDWIAAERLQQKRPDLSVNYDRMRAA